MEARLHAILLRSPPILFDEFMKDCQKEYDAPAHSLTELRSRENKKKRGDIFEEFCRLYLLRVRNYTDVWLLDDLPAEVRAELQLPQRDMGIDIICCLDGKYTAVQCKYKKVSPRSQVTWRELSTFQGLCAKTGPYEKHIVMTTAHSVRHQGAKTAKDLSICLAGLQGISSEDWTKMCGLTGHMIAAVKVPLSQEELRQVRLTRFGGL
jgi:predicted helicase